MESVYQWHCKVLMKAHVCQCECFCVKPNGHSLQEVQVIPAVSIWTLNTSQMSNTPTPHTTQWHLRVILNPNINFVFKHEVEFVFFLSLSLVPIMQFLCGQKWHYNLLTLKAGVLLLGERLNKAETGSPENCDALFNVIIRTFIY